MAPKKPSAPMEDMEDTAAQKSRKDNLGDAFGLWGERKIDGMSFQARLREEWSRK